MEERQKVGKLQQQLDMNNVEMEKFLRIQKDLEDERKKTEELQQKLEKSELEMENLKNFEKNFLEEREKSNELQEKLKESLEEIKMLKELQIDFEDERQKLEISFEKKFENARKEFDDEKSVFLKRIGKLLLEKIDLKNENDELKKENAKN
uniref:Uncharacterized protein n=1 Tax=Panagrolaimus sp. JU765 TaxID=591449 RepID=A0AC34R7D9_9BILA